MSGVRVNINSKKFFASIQEQLKGLELEVVIPHRIHPEYSVRKKTTKTKNQYFDEIFRHWDNYKDILSYVRNKSNSSITMSNLVKAIAKRIEKKGKDEDVLKAAVELISLPIKEGKFGAPAESTLNTRKSFGMGPLFIDSGSTLGSLKGRFKK